MTLFCGVSFSQTKSTARLIIGTTPVGFETEINDFLRQDSVSFPPSGVYLFTGSSTIRKWGNLQKDFDEVKDQLTDEEKTSFETAIADVDVAAKGDDVEAITNSITKLFEAASPVFAKKQLAEQKPEQSAAGNDTIDAEFTEV